MNQLPLHDRRRNKDRRVRPTSPLTRSSLQGSRRHARRKEDLDKHRFVDRYSFKAVLTIITIIVLSVLDASFTLKLVEIGAAREANPLMDFFLGQGPIPFLIFKYCLTVGSVICVLIFKNFVFWKGKISGKALIVGILVLYAVLIFYELMLFYKYNQDTL